MNFFSIFADLTSLKNHSNTDSHLSSNVDGKCERKNERENMRQTKTIDTFDILNVYERLNLNERWKSLFIYQDSECFTNSVLSICTN